MLTLPAPPTVGDLRRTKAEVVAEVDRLIENMTDSEIAAQLNQRGWRCSVNHAPSTARAVMILRWSYKLTSRADRLRAKGMVDTHQVAEILGTKPHLVDYWRGQGLLRGVRLNDKKEYLGKSTGEVVILTTGAGLSFGALLTGAIIAARRRSSHHPRSPAQNQIGRYPDTETRSVRHCD